MTIQNDNLMIVLQYLPAKEFESHMLVNRQWANLILNNMSKLPKLEIEHYNYLRHGRVWRFKPIRDSLELDHFPKGCYFKKLTIDATQEMFESLKNHAAKYGSILARDVTLLSILNSDEEGIQTPSSINFLNVEPRLIEDIVVTTESLKFDMTRSTLEERKYLFQHPSHFYSNHAKKVYVDFDRIDGSFHEFAILKTMMGFIFDQNSLLDNRYLFSMSIQLHSTSEFNENYFRTLFVEFYKHFQSANFPSKVFQNFNLYWHDRSTICSSTLETLNCYSKIPIENWPRFAKELKYKEIQDVFESTREDGWKMIIFSINGAFYGGSYTKLIPPDNKA